MMQEKQNKNLIKARENFRKMREAGITPERQDPLQKAKLDPTSLRKAVNAKCYDCSCGQPNEIRLCPVVGCSLYPVRPYKKKS